MSTFRHARGCTIVGGYVTLAYSSRANFGWKSHFDWHMFAKFWNHNWWDHKRNSFESYTHLIPMGDLPICYVRDNQGCAILGWHVGHLVAFLASIFVRINLMYLPKIPSSRAWQITHAEEKIYQFRQFVRTKFWYIYHVTNLQMTNQCTTKSHLTRCCEDMPEKSQAKVPTIYRCWSQRNDNFRNGEGSSLLYVSNWEFLHSRRLQFRQHIFLSLSLAQNLHLVKSRRFLLILFFMMRLKKEEKNRSPRSSANWKAWVSLWRLHGPTWNQSKYDDWCTRWILRLVVFCFDHFLGWRFFELWIERAFFALSSEPLTHSTFENIIHELPISTNTLSKCPVGSVCQILACTFCKTYARSKSSGQSHARISV